MGSVQAHGTDGRRLVVPFATRCRMTMLAAGRRSAAFLGSLSRKPRAKPRYSRRARTLSGRGLKNQLKKRHYRFGPWTSKELEDGVVGALVRDLRRAWHCDARADGAAQEEALMCVVHHALSDAVCVCVQEHSSPLVSRPAKAPLNSIPLGNRTEEPRIYERRLGPKPPKNKKKLTLSQPKTKIWPSFSKHLSSMPVLFILPRQQRTKHQIISFPFAASCLEFRKSAKRNEQSSPGNYLRKRPCRSV